MAQQALTPSSGHGKDEQRSALHACVNVLVDQVHEPDATTTFNFDNTEHLKRFAAAAEFKLVYNAFLALIRSDQPFFSEASLDVEYIKEKTGAYLFRQATQEIQSQLKTSLDSAKKLLRHSIALHRHGKHVLERLELGAISVYDAESAAAALLSIELPKVSSEEEGTEGHQELFEDVQGARDDLGEALLESLENGTSGIEFKRQARRLQDNHNPLDFETRAAQARVRRYVTVKACSNGMSRVEAYIPSHTGILLERILATVSRKMMANGSSDERSRSQLMADIFSDLITKNPLIAQLLAPAVKTATLNSQETRQEADSQALGAEMIGLPDGIGAHVILNVTLDQFLHLGGVLDDVLESKLSQLEPELSALAVENKDLVKKTRQQQRLAIRKRFENDSGSVPESIEVLGSEHRLSPSDAAIFISQMSKMSMILTDTAKAFPLGVGRKTYTPNHTLKLLTALRDHHCRAPGCRKPYFESEEDHALEFHRDQGGTDYGNLMWLCREHHIHKTAGWLQVRPRFDLGDGCFEFKSRHGSEYILSRPERPLHPLLWEDHQQYLEAQQEPPF